MQRKNRSYSTLANLALGRLLAEFRLRTGLTRKQVALKSGVGVIRLEKIEKGMTKIYLLELDELLNFYKVDGSGILKDLRLVFDIVRNKELGGVETRVSLAADKLKERYFINKGD